jgi:hypothetical protein
MSQNAQIKHLEYKLIGYAAGVPAQTVTPVPTFVRTCSMGVQGVAAIITSNSIE